MAILEVKNLSVELGGVKVLDNIGFEINKGDVLAIIGPNGARKTILLRSLLGLTDYSGEINWQKNVKIGYVPQRMDIETDIPLTVEEFFYLHNSKIDEAKIKNAMKLVQLSEKILKSGLGEISVGQRQRILVAWGALGNPDILLFDEPTADIDISGQESIYKMIYDLQNSGMAIILVSHDLNIVYRYAEKVLCLNRKNICFGEPKEILTSDQLQKLYGGEKGFYAHKHQ